MELSKQEMELFLLLPYLESKNFCDKIFSIFTKEFKTSFRNRKWNYQNRKWNYFSYFHSSKTSFTECFQFFPGSLKPVLETENGMISPILIPWITRLLLLNISHLYQGVQIQFQKQEMEVSDQEME